MTTTAVITIVISRKNKSNTPGHKKRPSVHTLDILTFTQVLKSMSDLLNAVSGELTNEKVKNQAHLVQEKTHALLNQITNPVPVTHATEEENTLVKKK